MRQCWRSQRRYWLFRSGLRCVVAAVDNDLAMFVVRITHWSVVWIGVIMGYALICWSEATARHTVVQIGRLLSLTRPQFKTCLWMCRSTIYFVIIYYVNRSAWYLEMAERSSIHPYINLVTGFSLRYEFHVCYMLHEFNARNILLVYRFRDTIELPCGISADWHTQVVLR